MYHLRVNGKEISNSGTAVNYGNLFQQGIGIVKYLESLGYGNGFGTWRNTKSKEIKDKWVVGPYVIIIHRDKTVKERSMDVYSYLIRVGKFAAANMLLRALATGRKYVRCWNDDTSIELENALENAGFKVRQDRRGNHGDILIQ